MKAVVVKGRGDYSLVDRPVSKPGPGMVLVRVAVTGMCRTDLKIIEAGHRDLVLPRIPGEEVVGHVAAVGADVDYFEEGQRVYVYPGQWCGHCSACRQGAENLCRDMQIMGFHRDGGFAQWVSVPAQSLIPLDETLGFDEAVFAEPLSCCLNALSLGGGVKGQSVGIWGGGTAGQLLARASRAYGANAYVFDPLESRHAMANGMTRDGGENFDVVIVAVGDSGAYDEAMSRLAARGRLVVFSGLGHAESRRLVDFNRFHYLEQSLVGAYGCCYRHGEDALSLIASGRVEVNDLITHRITLAEIQRALDGVRNKVGIKYLIYPNGTQDREV